MNHFTKNTFIYSFFQIFLELKMANADSSSRRGAQFGGGAIRPDDDYGKEATGQEGTFYGGKLNISDESNYV